MTQIFRLHLATGTIAADAKKLGVTQIQLQAIQVTVGITFIQQPIACLSFTYDIQIPYAHLATQLNWAEWQAANVNFTDFLWENTCLECFIASGFDKNNDAVHYIEINASPNGQYALYQFESYRNPKSLPPPPLLQMNKNTRAFINWHNDRSYDNSNCTSRIIHTLFNGSLNYKPIVRTSDFQRSLFSSLYCYRRTFSVPLAQLLSLDKKYMLYEPNGYIKSIHPCVILQFGQTQLYYAPAHASPPDFHQRAYWSPFKY